MRAGQDVFRTNCIGCHAFACNKAGPKLSNIIGRKAGTVVDFPGYTDELKNSGIVWSEQTLDTFLKDPGAMVPGTLMVSAGRIEDKEKRSNLIFFLMSGDTSLDLCF